MTTEETEQRLTTAKALEGWREAERTLAVARRGRVAAEAAAAAARDASEAAAATSSAAAATAQAARAALDAAGLAELSAQKTASAARVLIQQTGSDIADAETDVAMSEVAEAEAREQYREAHARAAERTNDEVGR